MITKRGFLALGLAAAVAVPYLFSSSGAAGLFSTVAGRNDPAEPAGSGHDAARPAHEGTSGADATPIVSLDDAFRFEVTTAWVLGRWPRVSAGLAELELHGYRVPLVTGTRPDDVAGSLTYYFNRQQRVERITFHGATGDARKLVALLATRFGFLREFTDEAGLYLYRVRRGGQPTSELKIKPAAIVRADSPLTRFDVSLVIERSE